MDSTEMKALISERENLEKIKSYSLFCNHCLVRIHNRIAEINHMLKKTQSEQLVVL
jgi:hypothetical protein